MTVDSCAYADDLGALTGNGPDLAIQGTKVDKYSDWGGLGVNAQKSAVSAIRYGRAAQEGNDRAATSGSLIRMVQRELERVRIAGQCLPFLHPDRDPYPYLGLLTTLSGNWEPQKRKLLQEIRRRGEKVLCSLCSPAQKVQYIQTSIRPYVTYSFPMGI